MATVTGFKAAGGGRQLVTTAVKTGPYVAAGGDLVVTSAAAGAVTHTLPSGGFDGFGAPLRVGFKKSDFTASTVTIACAGTDTFVGGVTNVVLLAHGHTVVVSWSVNLSQWVVESSEFPVSAQRRLFAGRQSRNSAQDVGVPIGAGSRAVAVAYTGTVQSAIGTHKTEWPVAVGTSSNVRALVGHFASSGVDTDAAAPLVIGAADWCMYGNYMTPMTFGGQPSITLQPGTFTWSDPFAIYPVGGLSGTNGLPPGYVVLETRFYINSSWYPMYVCQQPGDGSFATGNQTGSSGSVPDVAAITPTPLWGPIALYGDPIAANSVTAPSIKPLVVTGDSIDYQAYDGTPGTGINVLNPDKGGGGFWSRAAMLAGSLGYAQGGIVNLALPGDSVQNQNGPLGPVTKALATPTDPLTKDRSL